MATTQYIGARYVPLFYTASDNSNNWESGVQYEPLTIVTYLNQSYTSKIPVPASVGNPADNPTYWIMTGAYNAQVEQYRQEVETFSGRINSLEEFEDYAENVSYYKDKRIVVYGDSSGTYAGNFVDMLANTYGLNITNRCVGGSSLSEVHGGIASGLSVIQSASDLDNFDVALIIYGINDWQNSCFMYNWINAIEAVCTKFAGSTCEPIFIFPWYCYRLFTVYADENGTSLANRMGMSLPAYIDNAIDHLAHYGAKFINLYTLSDVNDINYASWLVNNGGIYVHAKTNLSEKVCRLILSGVMNNGKSCTFEASNIAGKIYNNVVPVNGQLNTDGFTVISRKTVANNMIGSEPIVSDVDAIYRIRGHVRANSGYVKLRVSLDNTQYYTVVAGSDFDIYTHGKTTNFYIVGEFFENSSTFANLENLEIYCTQIHRSKRYDIGFPVDTQLPLNYPTPKCYIDNGCINFDPVELIFTGNHSSYYNIGSIPLQTPSNVGTIGVLIGESPAFEGFYVVNHGRYIVSPKAFSNGDHICYNLPPIKLTETAAGYSD